MRQFGTICLVLLLLLSFARDPFFHLHEGHEHRSDEAGHERLAINFHAHVEVYTPLAHDDSQPRIGVSKTLSKVQPLSFFQIRPEAPVPMPGLAEEMAWFSPVVSAISEVNPPTPRAHDPPFVFSSIPRSPPA
jgi:hypothetical protein